MMYRMVQVTHQQQLVTSIDDRTKGSKIDPSPLFCLCMIRLLQVFTKLNRWTTFKETKRRSHLIFEIHGSSNPNMSAI